VPGVAVAPLGGCIGVPNTETPAGRAGRTLAGAEEVTVVALGADTCDAKLAGKSARLGRT